MFYTKIKCYEKLYFCKWPKSQFDFSAIFGTKIQIFWKFSFLLAKLFEFSCQENSDFLKITMWVLYIFRNFWHENSNHWKRFCAKKIISIYCYAKKFHDLPWYLTISLAHVLTPWINHSMKLHRMPFRVCLEVCYLSYYSSTCTRARDLTQHKKGRTRAQV